jgi:hypothetical protein
MSRYPKTGHFSEIREYLDFCNKNQKPVNLTHLRYLEMVAFKKFQNHEHYTYYMVDLELQEFVNEMVMRIFKEKGTKLTQEDLEGIKKEVADKYSDF